MRYGCGSNCGALGALPSAYRKAIRIADRSGAMCGTGRGMLGTCRDSGVGDGQNCRIYGVVETKEGWNIIVTGFSELVF